MTRILSANLISTIEIYVKISQIFLTLFRNKPFFFYYNPIKPATIVKWVSGKTFEKSHNKPCSNVLKRNILDGYLHLQNYRK